MATQAPVMIVINHRKDKNQLPIMVLLFLRNSLQKIANNAPLAVQATIELSRTYVKEGWEAGRSLLQPELLKILTTDDAKEGIASLKEKRDARFVGK